MNTLPFGHGERSYANLQTRKGIFQYEKKFPRAFLYPYTISDKINAQGNIDSEYDITMDFLTVCSLRDSQDTLEKRLYEMFMTSLTFLYKLANHPKVISVTDVEREPNYHVFDDNLCGYLMKFKIKLLDDYQYC